VTPRPRVEGPQTAMVTGPSGEEIHVDEFGRVKVRFHWDLEGPEDDKSSCWVRVSQGWSGAAFGAIFVPRIGQEVVLDFFEGDPDRPLITGRVYNGTNVHPESLPAQKTVSIIRTQTTPGGGTHNEIKFEDKSGSMMFHMGASKDMNVLVANNKTEKVGVNETHNVGSNHKVSVGANQTITVGNDRTQKVKVDEKLEVGGNQIVTIGGKQMIAVGGDRSLSVGGLSAELVSGLKAVAIKGASTLKVGAAVIELVGGAKLTIVKGDHTEQVGAQILACAARSITAKKGITETCAIHADACSGKYSIKSDGVFVVEASKALMNGTSGITLDAGGAKITMKSGKISIEGSSITVKASGTLTMKGSTIKEN
jgi:type VI secretion system secreted protein VgrG